MIIVFDTETTGLPRNWSAPMTDVDNWPRVIQLAWKLYEDDGSEVDSACDLILPDGWQMPNGDFWIRHGYSQSNSLKYGIPIADALDKFIQAHDKASLLVAHNISYDYPIVGAEMIRAGKKASKRLNQFCTMKSGKVVMGTIMKKWPKLYELHQYLFKQGFDGAHDAGADVDACGRCYFEIIKKLS